MIDVEIGLERKIVRDQIELIRLRNTSPAFTGEIQLIDCEPHQLHIRWQHPDVSAALHADLHTHGFTVSQDTGNGEQVLMSF